MYFFEALYNKIKDGLTKQQILSFFAAIIAGFLAHGYAFFNNYIYHDATILDNMGNTFGLGRWALGLSELINSHMLGSYHLPFFNTFFSVVFIACSAVLIVKILNIRSRFLSIFTGALLSVYPVVTSSFAYNFTALYYFIALILSVLALYIVIQKDGVPALLIASVVLAVSAGFYQAYLSIPLTLAVSYIMLMLFDAKKPVKDIVCKGVSLVIFFALGLVFYLVLNSIFVKLMKPFATVYQGMEEFGKLSIGKIPSRIKEAYLHFFYIKWNGINTSKFMWVLIILIIALCLYVIVTALIRKDCGLPYKLLFAFLATVYPLCVNLVYLFSTSDSYSVHTLMRYATAFVIIFPASIADNILQSDDITGIKRLYAPVVEVLMIVTVLSYIYADNTAYFKMNIMQEEMTSFYNTLRARIQSQEGYIDEMPVAFAGEFQIDDFSLYRLDELYPYTKILGYEYNIRDLINRESWKNYMKIHTGYDPKPGYLSDEILQSDDFAQMTVYPNDGSVKVICGQVVVKFSDN